MSRKESLFRGAAALAAAGLIIKVSNLLVRIPLTRLLDSEGLGIYQMALPAFYALFHIAAGGVPVAVQNLVAEHTAKGRRAVAEQVLRLALTYTTAAGGAAAAVLLAGAPILARLLGEHRVYWALVAVAPAVPLFAIDSVYRNYLQGRKLMTPSATASLLEQCTKVVVTLGAAFLLAAFGKDAAAGGAALGITAGAVVSVVYIVYIYRQIRREDEPDVFGPEPTSRLVRRLVRLAWPVTVGSVSMPLLSLLDVGIVQRGFLRAGYPQGEATAMYGNYSGIAVQVVWFPFVLTNAFANALVPVLAAAAARKDREAVRSRVRLGLRAAGLICLPIAIGVAILTGPIVRLFGEPQAARPLLFMAPVAYLGPLAWLMTAQLQALGHTGVPMRNHGMAMLLKIGLDALLAPVRGIDVAGVAIASGVMFLVCCWLNARELERVTGEPLPWGALLRGPLAASVVMGGGLLGLAATGVMPAASWASLVLALVVAPTLYVATLLGTRTVTAPELAALAGPLGPRLERLLTVLWPWS